MVEYSGAALKKLEPLFAGWEETMIWSCLQGCMGRAWADSDVSPTAAQILIGDLCFLAGDTASPEAPALARHLPVPEITASPFALVVPQNDDWGQLLSRLWGKDALPGIRYAFKKEPCTFDRHTLRAYVSSLPEGYLLVPIGRELYLRSRQEDWSLDFCSQFHSYEDYQARGAGFAIMKGEDWVCGASSYTVYNGGIEIEIGTKEPYRRRGLARVCAAALILHCLERGLYPSWDAANPASLALAEQLGYRFSHKYSYYAIRWDG